MPGVEGRVALVTGAGRGIGKATALALASAGARVMATARSEDQLATLGLDYVAADLTTPEGRERVVGETRGRLGPIEILVNNAGIGSAVEVAVWLTDTAVWDETMRVNIDAPFHLTRIVLAEMVERGWGRCVYVSSTAGRYAEPEGVAYNCSKHALLGLMRSVAADGAAYGVTANAVLPGWVRTEMAERSAAEEARRRDVSVDEIWAERSAGYAQGRVVTPEEVAETIRFLSSEESSGVNGEAILVALGHNG